MKDTPVPAAFLAWLHESGERGESWTRSALGVALELCGSSAWDAEVERSFSVSIDFTPALGKVTVHKRGIPDDSIYEEFHSIRLEEVADKGYWVPAEYRISLKGRGLSGWSQGPAI